MKLSKSNFIRYLQCKKSLYLNVYHKNLRDPIDEETKVKFTSGIQFGIEAQQLFPGGIDVSVPKYQYAISFKKTKQLINQGNSIIYEATFLDRALLILLDILVVKNGRLFAYEVKNSSQIKDVFLWDAAFQYYVMKECGYKPDSFILILHNPSQHNSTISSDFSEHDITEQCENSLEWVQTKVLHSLETLQIKRIPSVVMGDHCNTPYYCDFRQFCSLSK